MVVLLLVVVWLVALVPLALRWFSEWQLTASLSQFRDTAGAMRRVRPASSAPPGAVPGGAPGEEDSQVLEARRARERARAAELVARRRRVLTVLASSLLGTLVLGAIPGLGVLWDVSLVSFVATTGYVALLVRFRRAAVAQVVATERAAKVVSINSARRRDAGAAGAAGVTAPMPLPPLRPAFVLVDVRA